MRCLLRLHRPHQRNAVAADNLLCAVDHHLRSVYTLQVKSLTISILPVSVGRRGKGIGPAEPVPVRDMLADTNHQLIAAGPAPVHLAEQSIRGRAAGAPFRGE